MKYQQGDVIIKSVDYEIQGEKLVFSETAKLKHEEHNEIIISKGNIEKLTEEQKGKFKEYVDKYIKIGLRTDSIDKQKCINSVNNIYKHILNKKEVPIFFAESPLSGWLIVKILYYILSKSNSDSVSDSVWDSVRASVRDSVRASVSDSVWDFIWPYIDGHFYSSFFGFYDYMHEVLSIKLIDKYYIYKESLNFELMYPMDEFCVITNNPEWIHLNNQGKLHSEKIAAIRYRDGFEIYALNGVRVPKEIVLTSADELDCNLILKEKNVEVRREIIRKVGIDRIIKDLKCNELDKSIDGIYQLYEIPIGENRTGNYLKMLNPSIGTWHFEGVPLECDSVLKALAWRDGEIEYVKPVVLT